MQRDTWVDNYIIHQVFSYKAKCYAEEQSQYITRAILPRIVKLEKICKLLDTLICDTITSFLRIFSFNGKLMKIVGILIIWLKELGLFLYLNLFLKAKTDNATKPKVLYEILE